MDTPSAIGAVRLAFTKLVRTERPPRFVSDVPRLLIDDLRHHVSQHMGHRELAAFVGLSERSDGHEIVQRVLTEIEQGRIGFEVWNGTQSRWSTLETSVVDLADLAGAEDAVQQHALVIELVDDDDQPVAGIEYEVVLPDGSRRSGATNARGRARVSGLTSPDPCEVRFPSLDADAWESVRATPM